MTERSYEGAHSILKRRAPPNSAGRLQSLTLRLQDFAQHIQLHPSSLLLVAEHFGYRSLPDLLGVALHPELVCLRSIKQKWPVVKVLNRVLYRCDAVSQHRDMGRLLTKSKQDWEKEEGQGEQLAGQSYRQMAVSYNNIRAHALHMHFVQAAHTWPGATFSVPGKVLGTAGSSRTSLRACWSQTLRRLRVQAQTRRCRAEVRRLHQPPISQTR